VAYRLLISEEAREQIRSLPEDLGKNIGRRIDFLQQAFAGDIKKLEGQRNHYRLRVGGHRILFRMTGDIIEVYAVKQRKNVMSETQERELLTTVQRLAAEVARLRERVEDLEDAKDLDAAIGRNGEKSLIPWDQAKNELGIA
jgi:mRNA-degrading endonuclease RelE of RelBE toxin-antitoxin system